MYSRVLAHGYVRMYKYSSECGKREAHRTWSMVLPEKGAPFTGTIVTLMSPCRCNLGSEHHRYAIASPDKLGNDPIAVAGRKMDAVAESRRNPVSKHHCQPEQADAGRDGRTCLARQDSQARTCPCSANSEPVSRDNILRRERVHVRLITSRIGNLTD